MVYLLKMGGSFHGKLLNNQMVDLLNVIFLLFNHGHPTQDLPNHVPSKIIQAGAHWIWPLFESNWGANGQHLSENQISRASSVAGLWVVKHTFPPEHWYKTRNSRYVRKYLSRVHGRCPFIIRAGKTNLASLRLTFLLSFNFFWNV